MRKKWVTKEPTFKNPQAGKILDNFALGKITCLRKYRFNYILELFTINMNYYFIYFAQKIVAKVWVEPDYVFSQQVLA